MRLMKPGSAISEGEASLLKDDGILLFNDPPYDDEQVLDELKAVVEDNALVLDGLPDGAAQMLAEREGFADVEAYLGFSHAVQKDD